MASKIAKCTFEQHNAYFEFSQASNNQRTEKFDIHTQNMMLWND